MDVGLENQKVLITGSTAGIGLAVAVGFARERAHVIVNGRSEHYETRFEQVVARLRAA